MQAIIFRSDDPALLEQFVQATKLPIPLRKGFDGERIGSVLALRIVGDHIEAEIKCVPEDVGQ